VSSIHWKNKLLCGPLRLGDLCVSLVVRTLECLERYGHHLPILVFLAMPAAHHLEVRAAEPVKAHPGKGNPLLFDRDIRPLLSDNCFACHGPDVKQRKAKLYLDSEEDVFRVRGDYSAVVPGDVAKSELFRRLTTKDLDERMPPPESDRQLTKEQIDRIRRWIEQGAKWRGHWSFQRPERPPLPPVTDEFWTRNAIDTFILARLGKEGLQPARRAEKHALIRRVTLDVTGLPTTPAEIDAFFSDSSPDAYERVVDRLLRSPRYGEHAAKDWLDAARYADTNGYQIDNERFMWSWRDWVIDAFNSGMPFDQFTIEQLAGDLLPGATTSQKVATGFHRNHRINWEGGIIPEEFRVEYVADRVETTSTVWLGLTLRCARCHNHKYDPISQREFYGLFAFFNNITEKGSDGQEGNSVPFLKAPSRSAQEELDDIGRKLAAAEKKQQEIERSSGFAEAQALWEKQIAASLRSPSSVVLLTHGLVALYKLDENTRDSSAKGYHTQFKGGDPAYARGISGKAAEFDGKRFIEAEDTPDFERLDPFSFGAWVYSLPETEGPVIAKLDDSKALHGYDMFDTNGRIDVHLSHHIGRSAIRVSTEKRFQPNEWHHVFATYDGTSAAKGLNIYVDGEVQEVNVECDNLSDSIRTKEPLRVGSRQPSSQYRYTGRIDEVRLYDRTLSAEEVKLLSSTSIAEVLVISPGKRTPQQAQTVRTAFWTTAPPEDYRVAHQRVVVLRRQKKEIENALPTTMVMQEGEKRDTFLLVRGDYDRRGEKVGPGVPACLPPLPAGALRNRLGLAHWLVSPANPLTPRVIMNRLWRKYFGMGIVETVEDFGAQGERPSHPALLDWLASEFVRSGWNLKAMERRIVTSAAYRQSSKISPVLLERDPENRLFARGPRLRLSAEVIRDQALAIGGLLVEKLGGPSVKPYQPAGLWKELTQGMGYSAQEYEEDRGENLYRRSLYTFWKRTVPPSTMATFDAPSRETCVVRRSPTNTPLQALALMNDVTYVEASRAVAERLMLEVEQPEERLRAAFRLCTARWPTPEELKILVEGFRYHLDHFSELSEDAASKLVAVGDSTPDDSLDARELAATMVLASYILNLDETITKE